MASAPPRPGYGPDGKRLPKHLRKRQPNPQSIAGPSSAAPSRQEWGALSAEEIAANEAAFQRMNQDAKGKAQAELKERHEQLLNQDKQSEGLSEEDEQRRHARQRLRTGLREILTKAY
ncbi:hypothetical protein IQ07DRAFT_642003 [Pyrenochaeta sp. DS3sAY3a]|nr:hypothetical protein IQ07DRAFT_642003 [Pyrenochaeta sp. DS3sAY3a]